MAITATIQVAFQGANTNGILTAELDSRPEGYNGGRTTFSYGDEPVFLVRMSRNVSVAVVRATVGAVSLVEEGTTEEEEYLTYMNSKTANTAKPVSGGFESQWYGNDLGLVKLVGDNEVVIAAPGPMEDVGVLGVNYISEFVAYKLTGVPARLNGKASFNVLVAFIGAIEDEE